MIQKYFMKKAFLSFVTTFILLGMTGPCLTKVHAHMEQYPPFSNKNLPPHLQAEELIEFEGEVTIESEDLKVELLTLNGGSQLRIKNSQGIIFETKEDDALPFVFAVYYEDLDNNRLKDFIIFSNYHGCGLAGHNDRVDIVLQTERHTFSHIHYDTMSASLKDFVDINQDGIYEVVFTDFYSGKRHNYFVYSIYEIKGTELHNANKKYSTAYPNFIWFTYKPNDRQSTKITVEEKEEYLKRPPDVIKKAGKGARK